MTTLTRPAADTRPAAPATPTRRPLTDIRAMLSRELRRTLRSVDALVTALVLPVMIMCVFVVIFGGAIQRDGGYVDYVVPGVIIMCAGFGAAATAVAVAQDMASGTISRFKTMPIYGPSVLVGHVAASVLRNLLSTALVLLVAVGLGFRPGATGWAWVAVIGFVALAIVTFTWISCAVGLVVGVEAASSLTFVFLFLPYVSSGFVPVDTLPTWLHGFATHQPFTPITETMRALLNGSDVGAHLWPALAWLVGLGAAGFIASVALFRRKS